MQRCGTRLLFSASSKKKNQGVDRDEKFQPLLEFEGVHTLTLFPPLPFYLLLLLFFKGAACFAPTAPERLAAAAAAEGPFNE